MISDSILNEIMKKRNRGQYLQTGRQRFASNSLKCSVLVVLKIALDYNSPFFEDVRTIKEANIKGFCRSFLDLYIIGYQDLLDRLFYENSLLL